MMFRRIMKSTPGMAAALAVVALLCALQDMAFAEGRVAVVTTEVIYPGDTVLERQLKSVPITNPNLNGGYASSVDQVVGMITNRTLLPGRTIPVSALRVPFAVKRGASLRLHFHIGNICRG